MALTPMDIHNKEFKRRFRGYDMDEVDEFLDQVIRAFETLITENTHVKEQLQHTDDKLEQYRNLEETLNRTLVVAQSAADELKANARREADLIIQEARLQAERIIEAGRSKDLKLMEERAELARIIDTVRAQTRQALVAQLDILDRMLPGGVAGGGGGQGQAGGLHNYSRWGGGPGAPPEAFLWG